MSGYTKHGTDGTTNMALENPKGMSIRGYFCHVTIFFIFAHNLPYMYTLLHHTSLGAMQKALFSELQAFQSGWGKVTLIVAMVTTLYFSVYFYHGFKNLVLVLSYVPDLYLIIKFC